MEKRFAPGLPNGGLPFADKGPYPKGVFRTREGLLTNPKLEEFLKKPVVKEQPAVEQPVEVEKAVETQVGTVEPTPHQHSGKIRK